MPPFFVALTEALTEAVKYHVKWNTRRKDGNTLAEYYTNFGHEHDVPEAPDLPHQAVHVWDWFWEISGQRRSGVSGSEAIGWGDITDWSRLTDTQPQPEEVQMLIAMDVAYRTQIGEEQLEERKAQQAQQQ